jgi:hypothetical protein
MNGARGIRPIVQTLIGPLLVTTLAFTAFQIRFHKDMVDFEVYRQAGLRAAHAEPLYRPDDGHYQFKYLPAFALAMTPAALVDDAGARTLWYAFSVALLVLFARWSVRFLPERRMPFGVLVTVVIVLMAKFYLHELTLGQVNILFGVLLVGALGGLDVDLPIIGGVLVGAAVFVKPYGVIFVPWLLVSGGRRALLACVAVVALGLLLPAVVYGWSGNLRLLAGWFKTVTDSTVPNLVVSDNISFAGMWAKWIGAGGLAGALAAGSAAASLALAAWTWSKRRDIDNPNYLELAQLLLLVPLISPQGWDYVLLLGTPAVALLVDRSQEMGRGWRAFTFVALAVMGLSIFDVMGRAVYARFMATSIVSVCAVAAAIALARLRQAKLA